MDPNNLRVDPGLPNPHQAIAVFRDMMEGRHLVNDGQAHLAAALLEVARQNDPSNPSFWRTSPAPTSGAGIWNRWGQC